MTRITVETRKAYVISIGGKNRRFWTEGAAYYKLAASLLGQKYLGPLQAYETPSGYGRDSSVADVAERLDMTAAQVLARAERGRAMFYLVDQSNDFFDSRKWQAYVRRVAKKMRALDQHAARRAA